MARPNWVLNFIKIGFPRNPKSGVITKLPGVAKWLEKKFFDGDHLYTLPRSEVVKINRKVEDQNVVLPIDLIDYFIDKMQVHFIMNFCICRKAMTCKNYPIEYGCLFMGDATKQINPDWGRFVSKQEAKDHIRKCEQAGLIHFLGKAKTDVVWLNVEPGEKLLTVCNCCPCCCITRGMAYTDKRLSEKLIRAPGVKVEVTDDCIGCGACAKEGVCFSLAISMDDANEKAVISDACRGCGRCISVCKKKAIKISIDKNAFWNESISELRKRLDIPE